MLCALALVLTSPARAGTGIVAFIDADGVTHFTNMPDSPRYASMARVPTPSPRIGRAPSDWVYDGLISLTAQAHAVPPALVKAVVAAESRFNPEAVSHKGAQGLMQLMPETARELGVGDPLRADENLDGGVRYLRHLLDRYGDLYRALAAYNAGPASVDRYGGIPPYAETRDYVRRVLTYYRQYHGDFGR